MEPAPAPVAEPEPPAHPQPSFDEYLHPVLVDGLRVVNANEPLKAGSLFWSVLWERIRNLFRRR